MRILFWALILAVGLSSVLREGSCSSDLQKTCGYSSCYKSDPIKLNIHLVAHTHDDVGWLKTVDQYYFGGRMNIQLAGVQYIIDSVLDALVKNPDRKFIYVETAFLWKWWLRQNEERRQIVRDFINEGRLEIIGGGWSMNDEAVTHYHSMIDQYTWGFRRLNDTFGTCARPKIGWQIDPFGHSREQASMFAQLGFDGMFIGRLDWQDKNQRLTDKTAEFIWKGSPSLGESSNLFSSVLFNNYAPPPGFCFDILCQDSEPIIDDPDSPEYNVDKRVEQFLRYVNKQARSYATNNVILTMGEDFNYQNAEMYFSNLDKLIRNVNERNGSMYNAFYSTPSCYLKALNEQNHTWTAKNDDFVPYSSDPHSFWTGYYSSRPALKYFERMGNNFLQIVKQLSILSNEGDSKDLQLFREAMGVMQHHDAVTGTEKQHVAEDYARILYHSMKNGEKLASHALKKLALKKDVTNPAEFHSCPLLNISSCQYTSKNKKFVVTVYNPTSQLLDTLVRVPVQGLQYNVKDFTGKDLVTQLVSIPVQVQKIPGRSTVAKRELIFQAEKIAPLGYKSFYVQEVPNKLNEAEVDGTDPSFIQIGKENARIWVKNKNVFVQSTMGVQFKQSFQYYEGAEGNNKAPSNRSSGAYIFRPKNNITKDFAIADYKIFQGPLVEEMHLVYNDWISQVIRIYKDEKLIEFDWLVGPIPIGDKIGKEVITKYSSNLNSHDEFYTDSNGRDMLKRKLNNRPTWKLDLEEPVAGNYYPVTTKITIADKKSKRQLSVLTDRAQGGSSLKNGEIELMLHRRLLKDDAFGVGEALNETAYGEGLVVRGQHIILFGSTQDNEIHDDLILKEKEQAIQLALRPWIFVSLTQDSFEEWTAAYEMRGDVLVVNLPKNIQILTLEPWKDGSVLLRLEHLFEINETTRYSVATEVDLKKLFCGFNLTSVRELTLGANQNIEEMQRLQWNGNKNNITKVDNRVQELKNNFIVNMKPRQIRTFAMELSPANKYNCLKYPYD